MWIYFIVAPMTRRHFEMGEVGWSGKFWVGWSGKWRLMYFCEKNVFLLFLASISDIMPRKYHKKSQNTEPNFENLVQALKEVKMEKKPAYNVARSYNMPIICLKRNIKYQIKIKFAWKYNLTSFLVKCWPFPTSPH